MTWPRISRFLHLQRRFPRLLPDQNGFKGRITHPLDDFSTSASVVCKPMETSMTIRALALALLLLPGCAPVVIGAGAAVLVDQAIEQERGGDGLF